MTTSHEMNEDPNLLLNPVVLTPEEAQQIAGMYRSPIGRVPVPGFPEPQLPFDPRPWPTDPVQGWLGR